MKKVFAWVLLFVLLLGMFAGCKKNETEPTTVPTQAVEVPTASDAMEYVKAIYPNTEEALKTPIDYERMGVVRISDIPFTVVWTTDLSEDLIKIVPSEDGTMVTIDINEQCEMDTPYVLTATITDEAGNVATHSWNCILPQAVDMVSIVEQAYALKKGESLPFECTLIGKIVSIDKPYDPDYKNITVTIAVEGAEKKPIQCYRLKGDGAENLLVGNIITVTGTIKNYNGTIEFDAGCILEAVEKGDAVEAPTDVGEILKAAYKLKKGKALPYPVELTGVVTEIDKPYDPGYKNISVVIEVEGYSKYPILCYRLKGKDAENIAVGDTITVNGIIKNYEGTIEYDAGCQLLKRVSGGGVALKPSSDEAKILRDAKKLKEGQKLAYIATLTGEVISVDSAYDSSYKNVTVTMLVAGTKIQCYRMKGDDASKVRVTDKITVTGQIENYYGKLEFGSGCTLDKWVKGSRVVKIDMGPLKENTAYKMEMKLPTLGKNVYFDGGISSSHYLYTGTYEQGVDVFMEKTEGKGVRFYFLDGEAKTYIEIKTVKVANKDTGKLEDKVRPQLSTSASVYWTYSEEAGVYTVDVNGTKYYLGTYLNNGTVYETASCSSIYYITDANAKNKGKTQFYFDFVTKASDAPEVPVEPEKPAISGLPAYNAELKTGDKVVIYAPAYSKALSTEKVAQYYNKGVDLTVKNKALSGYGSTETWTVTVNKDGTVNFANGGKNIALADEHSSMDLGEKHDDWQLISLGNGLYNIKNVGRNYFMEWYATKDNWSAYSSANGDQFELSIYVIGKGVLTEAADEPETPDEPDTPAVNLPTEDGAEISIPTAIAAGNAMAQDTFTTNKYKVTGVIDEIYNTVYGNMYIKDAEGNRLKIYGTYDATGENKYESMAVKPAVGDTVVLLGVIGNFNGAQMKNGWVIEHTPAGGTTPEQPPVTPDDPETPAAPTVVDAPVAGTAYKFGMVQGNVSADKVFFIDGAMNSYYMNTTEDTAEAADVYLEETTGGYYLYAMVSGAKKYVNMVVSGEHVNGAFEDAAATVYTYDAESKTVVATVNDTLYWFGTRNDKTYTTVGPVKVEYEGFYCQFYTVGDSAETPDEPEDPTPDTPVVPETPDYVTAPEAGKAYKLGFKQIAKNGDVYYFTGAMSATATYYGDANTDASKGVDMYLEAVTGGYHLYFNNGTAKQYINIVASGNHINFTFANTATSVFVFDEEVDALCTTVNDAVYYMGTNDNFVTFGTIAQSNAAKENYYPARLYAIKSATPETPEDPDDTEVTVLTVAEALAMASAMEADQYTTEKYKVTGVVDTITSAKYGNMSIKGEDGSVFGIYGTWNADGSARYGDMSEKPGEGSTVTLLGIIGNYQGNTPQMKDGWILEFTAAPEVETPANAFTYDFSTFSGTSTQYAEETHDLGSGVSLSIVKCHLNQQLRIYSSATNNGVAIFKTDSAIKSVKFSAGYKDDVLNVYGSVDGETWTLVKAEAITSAYGNHTIEMPADTSYKYLKLDVEGTNQIRVANISIDFAD